MNNVYQESFYNLVSLVGRINGEDFGDDEYEDIDVPDELYGITKNRDKLQEFVENKGIDLLIELLGDCEYFGFIETMNGYAKDHLIDIAEKGYSELIVKKLITVLENALHYSDEHGNFHGNISTLGIHDALLALGEIIELEYGEGNGAKVPIKMILELINYDDLAVSTLAPYVLGLILDKDNVIDMVSDATIQRLFDIAYDIRVGTGREEPIDMKCGPMVALIKNW